MLWYILSFLCLGALVNGPLFSLDASGQIGKALVYSKWKGRNYVREYVVGANPNTLAQRVRRVMFGFLSKLWADMDASEQGSWTTSAAAKEISTFNEMMSTNMDRQTNELAPTANETPAGGALTGTVNSITPTGGIGKIDAVILNTVNNGAGEYNLVSISDVSFADAQSTANSAFIGLENSSDQTFDITDLDPGTYWLSLANFNQGGTLSSWVDAAGSTTVT